MIHTTHILFGVFLIFASFEGYPSSIAYIPFIYAISSSALGALFPDIDHPNGYLSRGNWRLISLTVRKTTSHRGWTHSISGAVFFSVIAGAVIWYYNADLLYAVPFFIGYISHLMSDSLNPTGVNWLWPITRKKFRINLIKTGSKQESIFQSGISFGISGIIAYDVMFNAGMLLNAIKQII